MRNKRIILVGASAAGKSYIKEKFRKKGFKCDVSYTSREPREGEVNGIDYKFISKESFEIRIDHNMFYEHVQYGGNYYGTGMEEWYDSDIFIMETDGISKIKLEDRGSCLIFYVNTPLEIRIKRMEERNWDPDKIVARIRVDKEKFNNFTDFDLEISSYSKYEVKNK